MSSDASKSDWFGPNDSNTNHDQEGRSNLELAHFNGRLFASIDLSLAAVFYIFDLKHLALIFAIAAVAFLFFSIGLSRMGFDNLSRISTVIIGSVLVTACSLYFGRDYLLHAALLLGAIFPFIYFRPDERLQILIGLSVPVLCYTFLEYHDFRYGPQVGEVSTAWRLVLQAIFLAIPYFAIAINIGVAVFGRDRANQQLVQSQAQLRALFQTLSHDISTPVTVAGMAAREIYQDGKFSADTVMGDRLLRALNKVERTLLKLKSIANVLVKKEEIQLVEVNIEPILENLRLYHQKELQAKGQRFELSLISRNNLKADPTLLEIQILQNLISNAIKFSRVGGTISVKVQDASDGRVQIDISDSGPGVSAAKLAKLFSWSERTSSVGTSGEIGHGFGLPIVKLCTTAIGGEVEALSGAGGMTFSLRFEKWEA